MGFYCYRSVRLWALSGEVLMEMVGHTEIIYSVDSHASGLIVSGGEDRHAKIWKGNCLCSLLLVIEMCHWNISCIYLMIKTVYY